MGILDGREREREGSCLPSNLSKHKTLTAIIAFVVLLIVNELFGAIQAPPPPSVWVPPTDDAIIDVEEEQDECPVCETCPICSSPTENNPMKQSKCPTCPTCPATGNQDKANTPSWVDRVFGGGSAVTSDARQGGSPLFVALPNYRAGKQPKTWTTSKSPPKRALCDTFSPQVIINGKIGKAGGTTLDDIFKRMAKDGIFEYRFSHAISENKDDMPQTNALISILKELKKSGKKAIVNGHFRYIDTSDTSIYPPNVWINFMRDPTVRIMSHIQYVFGKAVEPTEFYERPWGKGPGGQKKLMYNVGPKGWPLRNRQTHYLLSEDPFNYYSSQEAPLPMALIHEILDSRFAFIGLTPERFPGTFELLEFFFPGHFKHIRKYVKSGKAGATNRGRGHKPGPTHPSNKDVSYWVHYITEAKRHSPVDFHVYDYVSSLYDLKLRYCIPPRQSACLECPKPIVCPNSTLPELPTTNNNKQQQQLPPPRQK